VVDAGRRRRPRPHRRAGRRGALTAKEQRAALLARADLTGHPLREALVDLYDGWLAGLLGDAGPGVALVAVGGLGRREPALGSDLDLVLVHDGRRSDVGALADAVWYPVWDAGVCLDHSVRTVPEAVAVARHDLKAALGLLDARHVAGDTALSRELLTAARAAWRADADRRLRELRDAGDARAREHGEVAFLLEPDLKIARGGLRDVHALHAVAATQRADPPGPAVRTAHALLLDVRGELHRRTGSAGRRPVDRLLLQEQDGVAAVLGYSDADALMAAVSDAARVVSYATETTWRRVAAAGPRRRSAVRRRRRPVRTPLADDVVAQDGEVVLARDADPSHDPVLVLRVARAAAQAGLPVARATLDRLARECPDLPVPWPRPALDALVGLLASGPAAVAVLEHLDQAGLLVRLLPEWAEVRSRPQRNRYHRFTVDRHLVEAAAAAAALTRRVARPDLLLLGALLHDIGKGRPGDHTEVGMATVADLGPRFGLPPDDVDVLVRMVEHHLLLPDVATRRDLSDPATAQAVAAAVGSQEVLDLLHALTEADALATGPAAWSPWKARLVGELVERTRARLAGAPPPADEPLADWQAELVATGGPALATRGDEVAVVAPDRRGLLALTAGVLALHRLDVRSAWAGSQGATAVSVFRVAPRFGALPDWAVVQGDLLRALSRDLPLAQRLAAREAAYARPGAVAPPVVRLVDDASAAATVVEVRAPDGLGVLHRLTEALDRCGLDVRTAHVSTLGDDVVDAFYVVGPDGGPLVDAGLRKRVVEAVDAAAAVRVDTDRGS
jgi:[protein-PII] uridylyltransferase